MAENNRNRGWNRSQQQQWNEGKRSNRDYNQERDYSDYGNRYGSSSSNDDSEYGSYGSWSDRYGNEGYDRNRNQRSSYGGSYGNSGNRYWSDNRDYANNRNRENDYENNQGSSWGSSDSSNFRSSYQNDYPDYEDYSRGSYGNSGEGYRNYGGTYGNVNRGGFSGNRFGSGGDYNRGRQSSRYAQQDYWPYEYARQDSNYGNKYESQQGERDWWDKTTDEVSSWFGNEEAERRREQDRRREGRHRGKGPKGYQRSDERIKDDINDRLSDDAFVDASDIDVTVQNGEVTLTGTVQSRSDKRRAEDVAEAVSGVKNVEVRLRVQEGSYDSGFGRSSYVSNSAVTGTTSATADKNKLKQSSLTESK
ncbi:BON domain-containing protein [Pseudochryseolinea flava]|uniref:BON domain-containing protein n=1 Tax=Pseudochryseolinea flava TaxID=2059302 RepID=A0A364Y4Z5_9BACT|nr:BON domain-containing protein [Pseudochryseolinea flava]RAW01394.1 hypothetical protein DQQ10_10860 [Pseudochryseolinea flava]